MHREKYWNSKIPLPLALLFLLNVFLVVAFQLLFSYKLPAKADEAVLGKYDTSWSGSTILSQDSYSINLTSYLLELPDGTHIMVATKTHPIITGRAKLVSVQPVDLSDSKEQIFYVKNGIHTAEIAITGGDTVDIRYGYDGGIKEALTLYLVLGSAMEGLELLVYYFIKKNL